MEKKIVLNRDKVPKSQNSVGISNEVDRILSF